MAKFYDISNWQEKPHFQTGGTRNKQIIESPQGKLYYFKTSLKKEIIDYKYEFWSEIIASEIGKELGFNTLKYDIAYNKGEIGCLSKSMVDTNQNKLSEGIKYLRGYDPNYIPDDKNSYSKYTFHFIEKALTAYRLKDKMQHIVTTIIFDSLIGNGDRHQENWGFIIPNMQGTDEKIKNKLVDSKLIRFIVRQLIGKKSLAKKEIDMAMDFMKGVFSPIYDSGSCLGRELTDERVDKMLHDNQMLEAYINRDKCEIRWEDEKISHFEIIKEIRNQSKYKEIVEKEINRIVGTFKKENIENIVNNIDNQLPANLQQYKLPENRKKILIKFVSLRFDKLRGIIR
jgi:hypothetical protein